MFPNLIKYTVHQEPSLPPFDAMAYEYIFASNGTFLRAENRFMEVIIPIVEAPQSAVRGLYPLAPSIKLKVPLMPTSLLQDVLADARQMRTDTDQLLEALYRFHHNGLNVRVDRPSQTTSTMSVKATGDGGTDVILEIHSHGNMKAFWSSTDDRDEQGFRLYGVIGRLDSNAPEIRIRVGVHGYHYPITQEVIFSDTNNSPFTGIAANGAGAAMPARPH